MKICLINSPYRDVYKLTKSALGKAPPITLAYLAAYLRNSGHKVSILDVHNLEISLEIEQIKKNIPEDTEVVGVSSMTPSYHNSLRVLEVVKQILPRCITVMGGPHISAIPEQVMSEAKNLDFGVIGEGEETFVELLDLLSSKETGPQRLSRVRGIAFRDNQKVKITPKRELMANFDRLPIPAYDLLNIKMYEQKPHHIWANRRIHLKPFMFLFTSRGCPHLCTFCASKIIWGRRVRFKSVDYVLKEIDILVNEFGVKSLYICDDTFLANRDRAVVILRKIIDRNYDLNFCCMARVDEVDQDLLQLLRQAKCHLIRFGVESCSQNLLDAMKKGYSVDQVKRAFRMCKQAGLAASASIIVGYPGETKTSFSNTLKLLKEIDPTGCDFFIALPIVGTEFYQFARSKGYMIERDWPNWTLLPDKPIIETEHLKANDLLALRRKGYLDFYLRPAKLWQILSGIRNLNDVKTYLKGLCAMLGLIKASRIKN